MIKYIITMMLLTTACTSTQTSEKNNIIVKLHTPEKGDCTLYKDNNGWFVCKTEDNRYFKVYTDKVHETLFSDDIKERLQALNQAQVNFDMLSPTEQWYSIETGDFIIGTVRLDKGEFTVRSHTVRGKVISWEDMANGKQHAEEIKL
tara:strand:- start:46 stop:486 length:441 start_codon:yes stop_codon:yes gene_type:complete